MDGPGLLLHLTPEEVEAWSRTLLRVAGLLGMNQVPDAVSRYNREHLLAMAHRLDCEQVRRAARDAEMEGTGLEGPARLRCRDCGDTEGHLHADGDGLYCPGCYKLRKSNQQEPQLTTLPREWEG